MRIQVYGAGMAGSFLYLLLGGEFEVGIWDVRFRPDCRCAWGTVYDEAKGLYRMIGINFDEYVLVKPENVVINGVRFRNVGVVTFDRKRLLEDIWSQIDFGKVKADLIVDATGHERAFLPKIRGDELYSTIQFIEKHKFESDLFIYMRRTGYAWAFPLGDDLWHVGVGEKNSSRALELLAIFRRKYGFNGKIRLCSCRGKVRLLPPSRCKPFSDRNIVGVGEAIGCVSGFGEGNIPALKSAKILYECLINNQLSEYEGKILKEFEWIETEHQLIRKIQSGKRIALIKLLPKVVFTEAKRTVKPPPEVFKYLTKYLVKLSLHD